MIDKEIFKVVLGRLMMVVFICGLLISSIFYLNQRWQGIRDIRRKVDAQAITKALDYYNLQFGQFPKNIDDDGEGWDKSNDDFNRSFLEPVIKIGLLPNLVFDPQNDEIHYYRYQRFEGGAFGCDRPYAVFQISSFEDPGNNQGRGQCPKIDWTKLAPNGYTWFSVE